MFLEILNNPIMKISINFIILILGWIGGYFIGYKHGWRDKVSDYNEKDD